MGTKNKKKMILIQNLASDQLEPNGHLYNLIHDFGSNVKTHRRNQLRGKVIKEGNWFIEHLLSAPAQGTCMSFKEGLYNCCADPGLLS